MLERITLKNFRKHESKVIDFDPHVTTIVGPSARGKTNVLQALNLVCLNRPRGKNYVRNRKGTCQVVLEVDGRRISRHVGKGINTYHLDGKRYVSFGSGKLPSPVSNLLRVGPVNFQRQLDPVFLFSESPGQVSKSLNEVINLQLIDGVQARAASKVREEEKNLEACVTNLDQVKEQVDTLDYVDALARDFNELRSARKRYRDALRKTARTRARIQRALELRRSLFPLSELKFDTEKLIQTGARLHKLRRSAFRLKKAVELAKEFESYQKLLKDADSLTKFRTRADKIVVKYFEADKRHTEARELAYRLKSVNRDLTNRRLEFDKLSKGRCPVCQRPMKSSSKR